MSKRVKNIITSDLSKRLDGVQNALLVNVIGLEVNTSNRLRRDFAAKGIRLLVVKNSLAARATQGTPLDGLFKGLQGSCAVVWGDMEIVNLAKEIVKVSKDKAYAKFEIRGGILDGEAFAAAKAVEISTWPTREEQIALLLGQIIGVGSKLSGQLLSVGAKLASQFEKLSDGAESDAAETAEAEAPAAE